MGIVVSISLLSGLLVFLARELHVRLPETNSLGLVTRQEVPIAWILLFVGLWNIFWYGLHHLNTFWGHAAMASGVFMVLAAILLRQSLDSVGKSLRAKVYRFVRSIKVLVVTGLLASFLLYAITLLRLNFGMEIIK